MNSCEHDLLNNCQQNYKRREYSFNSVIALMDRGNIRKKQEDSLLVSKHKLYPNNEILLIADGMGGLNNGAFASNLAATNSLVWFQSLKKLNSINSLKKEYEKFVLQLDDLIRIKCGDGGTTLVTAFLLEDVVLIANIGDSRAYIYDNNELIQVTKDQSVTQKLLDDGMITSKEHMRFHKKNNLILSRLGCEKRLLTLDFYEIDIEKMNQLYLFSDGITDCVSDSTLNSIISSNTFDQIPSKIINIALSENSHCPIKSQDYYEMIQAGKDNASIIGKIKRRK